MTRDHVERSVDHSHDVPDWWEQVMQAREFIATQRGDRGPLPDASRIIREGRFIRDCEIAMACGIAMPDPTDYGLPQDPAYEGA